MLKNKRKFILVCLLGILTLFLFSDFSFATELEIEYPTFGDAQTPMSTRTWLPDYIKYIFNLSLMFTGIIAFGSLAYGGFCYLIGGGNPTAIKEGKDQILASILGLIIILCSFLILNTINPQLLVLNPTIKSSPTNPFIILYSQSGCPGGANPEQSGGIEGIDYMKIRKSKGWLGELGGKVRSMYCNKSGDDLNIINYHFENWEGGHKLHEKHSAKTCISDPGKTYSVELVDKHKGVYLCKDGHKSVKNCLYYNHSSAAFPATWDNQITQIFFNQPEEGAQYRAILHEKTNYKGACDYIETKTDNPKKINDTINWVSSITIFKEPEKETSGNGVILYENRDYNVETCDLHPECVNGECDSLPEDTSSGCFCDGSHLHANQIDTPENFNFGDSIYVDGDYVAILYEYHGFGGECEVFFESDPFLRDNPIAKCPTYEYSVLWPWPISTTPHACFKSYIVRQGTRQ